MTRHTFIRKPYTADTCEICALPQNECTGDRVVRPSASKPGAVVVVDPGVVLAPLGTFQQRVRPWMQECFGPEIAADMVERGDRFLEEALELLQAHGYDRRRIAPLVDYVFGRPIGEAPQEVGGVMVTLAAYCDAAGIDMHDAGEIELARVWLKVEAIRAKQAGKRDIHSPLPTASSGLPPEILEALHKLEETIGWHLDALNGEHEAALTRTE